MEQKELFPVNESHDVGKIAVVECPLCKSFFLRKSEGYNFEGTFDVHLIVQHDDWTIENHDQESFLVYPEELVRLNIVPTVPLHCTLPQIEEKFIKRGRSGYSSKRKYTSVRIPNVDCDI